MSHADARFREIEVERIVLREPKDGRVRAVLESAPAEAVRLTLLSPAGDTMLVAEVGADGLPRLYVGPPDAGACVAISRDAVDLWSGGNIVASLRSTDDGGRIELGGADGRTVVELPGTHRLDPATRHPRPGPPLA